MVKSDGGWGRGVDIAGGVDPTHSKRGGSGGGTADGVPLSGLEGRGAGENFCGRNSKVGQRGENGCGSARWVAVGLAPL